MFKLGDKVIMIEDYDNARRGWIGTVMRVPTHNDHRYAIEFENNFGGHLCGGVCKNGHGHNVPPQVYEVSTHSRPNRWRYQYYGRIIICIYLK